MAGRARDSIACHPPPVRARGGRGHARRAGEIFVNDARWLQAGMSAMTLAGEAGEAGGAGYGDLHSAAAK